MAAQPAYTRPVVPQPPRTQPTPAQPSHAQLISVDEWRTLEAKSEVKHEYIDGRTFVMSGGSRAHGRIAINVIVTLEGALNGSSCLVYPSDVAVRLSPMRYVYPDVTVSCDPHDQATVAEREIYAPRVIVEVLSDSTERTDRVKKLRYYSACPTIQEYMLVITKYQAVEVYRRTESGLTAHQLYEPDGEVQLTSIGVTIPVSVIYRSTDVPETLDDAEEA